MDESLLNFSRVEEDPFVRIPTENVTEAPFRDRSAATIALNYTFLIFEFANFFLGIAAVVSDVLIVYFVFRFKRLRKNMNIYVANFALMNLIYYITAPVLLLAHVVLALGNANFYNTFCYVSTIEYTFLTASFVIVTCMGLEWTVSILQPGLTKRCRVILKAKYAAFYSLLGLILLSSLAGCLAHYEIIKAILYYQMPTITLCLIVMHYTRRKRVLNEEQLKTEYALWVFTMAVGFYIPIFFLDLLLNWINLDANHTITILVFLSVYICSFLSVPTPVYILYYLIKWNKHFKMAFDTTFKKSVRTYGADNLDDASDNEDIVQDDRHKNTQMDGNGLSRAEIMVP